jgi:Raf kinase inhibitor-like YbhB/YbcL family protein
MPEELTLTTTSFASGESIPREFTCEGTDISPPPEWNPVPATTESIVLIVDDPDAPGQTFTHWVLFSLPGGTTRLPREVDSATYFADADPTPKEGQNDFGDANYGPCPPPGDGPHRYVFRLYALDTVDDLNVPENLGLCVYALHTSLGLSEEEQTERVFDRRRRGGGDHAPRQSQPVPSASAPERGARGASSRPGDRPR